MKARGDTLRGDLTGPISAADEAAWESLGSKLLSPEEPGMEAALAVAREAARASLVSGSRRKKTSAEIAWALSERDVVDGAVESLVTRLGAEWLLDGSRSFLPFVPFPPAPSLATPPPEDLSPSGASGRPYAIETAVSLAAAGDSAVRVVEECAVEAASRLSVWGIPRPRGVAWISVPTEWPQDPYAMSASSTRTPAEAAIISADWQSSEGAMGRAYRLGRRAREIAGALRRGADESYGRAVTWLAPFVYGYDAWRTLAAWDQPMAPRMMSVQRPDLAAALPMLSPPLNTSSKFGELPDALDPFLVIASLGYVLIDVRYDVAVLGAPVTFAPVSGRSNSSVMTAQRSRYGSGISRAELVVDKHGGRDRQ